MTAAAPAVPDLIGWKAIADFLRVKVRTVQYWAEEAPYPWMAALPVFDSIWGKAAFSVQIAAWAGAGFVPHVAGAAARRGARLAKCSASSPQPEAPRRSRPRVVRAA